MNLNPGLFQKLVSHLKKCILNYYGMGIMYFLLFLFALQLITFSSILEVFSYFLTILSILNFISFFYLYLALAIAASSINFFISSWLFFPHFNIFFLHDFSFSVQLGQLIPRSIKQICPFYQQEYYFRDLQVGTFVGLNHKFINIKSS